MSGTTKTFYVPVGNVSEKEARKLMNGFRKDTDGVIRLKSEPKSKK